MKKSIVVPKEYTYISPFLTMGCNLNCSFCLNTFDKSFNRERFKEISGEEWARNLNRIELPKKVPITFTGGEPFLHQDFIYIINNLKLELDIDILTNLYFEGERLEKFISEVNPDRIKRDASYSSIRVSYHPEQMGNGKKLVENVKRLRDAGFSIGVWSVLYPSPKQLSAINQMQFRCREAGIDFRLKEHTGFYKGELYGDYSKYLGAVNSNAKSCLCKNSDLLFGPNGNIYKCHRDLYVEENPVDNIMNPNLQIDSKFRSCDKYGHCHPCDVKVKTNYKQELRHTSVEIKNVR
jgi:sulfatase maturation enzyme AslB (radical SAM superfamily)